MDDIRLALSRLVERASKAEQAAWRSKTPEEFAEWLDSDLLNRDPQVPLADMYILIEDM
jgi:hypothetical protein